MTPYNPNRNPDDAFNSEANPDWRDINPDHDREAMQDLIDTTHEELFSEEN